MLHVLILTSAAIIGDSIKCEPGQWACERACSSIPQSQWPCEQASCGKCQMDTSGCASLVVTSMYTRIVLCDSAYPFRTPNNCSGSGSSTPSSGCGKRR
eukprot:807857-Amphidinium_carterae.1